MKIVITLTADELRTKRRAIEKMREWWFSKYDVAEFILRIED